MDYITFDAEVCIYGVEEFYPAEVELRVDDFIDSVSFAEMRVNGKTYDINAAHELIGFEAMFRLQMSAERWFEKYGREMFLRDMKYNAKCND